MATYGRFEKGEELYCTPATSVCTAKLSDSDRPCIIKIFRPDGSVFTPEQVEAQTASFLEAAKIQQQTAASGARHWAPIDEFAPVPDGAYYATSHYPSSVKKLLAGRVHMDEGRLFLIADGIVRGLVELKKGAGRAHGNLKPSNILLDESKTVHLSDPDGHAAQASEANDLYALGQIIYELAMQRPSKGAAVWPITASIEWTELGRSGEHWRELCNRLLNPSHAETGLTLEAVDYALAALSPARSRRKAARRTVGTVILLTAAALVGTHFVLLALHPDSAPAPALGPAPAPAVVASKGAGPASNPAEARSREEQERNQREQQRREQEKQAQRDREQQQAMKEQKQQKEQDRIQQEQMFAAWVAALTAPNIRSPVLQGAWESCRKKELAALTDPDPVVQERLDSLRKVLEEIEQALPPQPGLRPSFAAAVLETREALLQQAADTVAAGGRATELILKLHDFRLQYASTIQRQVDAQHVADLVEKAKGLRAGEDYAGAVATLDDALKIAPGDSAAKGLRDEINGILASPDYKQKLFSADMALLLKALEPKIGTGSGISIELSQKLRDALSNLRFNSETGRELLDQAKSFADGKTAAPDFVAYLNRFFETPAQRAAREAAEQRQQKIAKLLDGARASAAAGKSQEAKTALDELLKLDPQNTEALALKTRLESSAGPAFATSLGMTFVLIDPPHDPGKGTFMMGSPPGEFHRGEDETLHKVTLTRPFKMTATLVTRGQFAAFVAETGYKTDAQKAGRALAVDGAAFKILDGASWVKPGFDQTEQHPVVEVSWNDAVAFCRWLSAKDHNSYRLPTEAEWEYACRAPPDDKPQPAFFWGDDPQGGEGFANCADLTMKEKFPKSATFHWRDGFVYTSPVASFKPNKFGLYDMIGNAWEWCSDFYGPYPPGDAVDPVGPPIAEKDAHVLRGGAWFHPPRLCRCAVRHHHLPAYQLYDAGFRVCLDLDLDETPAQRAAREAAEMRQKLASLLAIARAGSAAGKNAEATTALNELLKLDPQNADALALLAKIKEAVNATFENSRGMKFVRIPPGEFDMGSPINEPGRFLNETPHHVKITRPFYMGAYLVTRGQFAAFITEAHFKTDAEVAGKAEALVGNAFKEKAGTSWRKPGFDQTDQHPVVEVSWNDAVEFCKWLSEKEHKKYRLPTEAEWEYACRAGSSTAYFWGDDPDGGQGYANCADLTAKDKFPNWTTFNWRDGFVFTSPVGSFKANNFGLYDMAGNAWEWCSDYYAIYPPGKAVDPTGPAAGDAKARHVLRGGAWEAPPRISRCARRYEQAPGIGNPFFGFRVCLDF